MSRDSRDENWTTDRDGHSWMTGSDGEYLWDSEGHRVPGPARKISKPGDFTEFDSSQGHCGLCGSLHCRGGCFK